MSKVSFDFELDEALASDFTVISKMIGIEPSVALGIFAKLFVAYGGFPFEVTVPNAREVLGGRIEAEHVAPKKKTQEEVLPIETQDANDCERALETISGQKLSYWDLLYAVAKTTGTRTTKIGPALGLKSTYVATGKTKGSNPTVVNAARMLKVCGYGLYALPYDRAPENAFQVDCDS